MADVLRLDGKPVGRVGLRTISTQVLLTAGATAVWPRNDKRVALVITNIGDAAGGAGGLVQVKPVPDEDLGLTGSNGHMLGFLGSFQFDSSFPWIGIVNLVGVLANAYVVVTELYDGG